MRIVLALDKFKGTFTAQEACEQIAEGIHKRSPNAEVILRPMADGGEGSAVLLAAALGMEKMPINIPDLTGANAKTHIYWQNSRRIALIESSSVLGIERAHPSEHLLLNSSSFALGNLLKKSIDLRPAEIWIGVGGTLVADAGWGIATALGLKSFDNSGEILSPCPTNMSSIAGIDVEHARTEFGNTRIVALCDVNAPAISIGSVSLLSFLEQKGAKSETIPIIEKGIRHFAAILKGQNKQTLTLEDAFTGAGGGLCIGLSALYPELKIELGAKRIARATALSTVISGSDLVVCGEGCFDETTFYGKAPIVVSELAQNFSIPMCGVFGSAKGNIAEFRKRLNLQECHLLFEKKPFTASELIRQSRLRLHEIGVTIAHRLETSLAKA